MEVADLRVPSGVTVLAAGIDALYLSGRCLLPHDTWTRLLALKAEAASGERPEFALTDQRFRVGATGMRQYAVRLEHEHCVVLLTDSVKLPTVWIQLRAEFLHAVGPLEAVSWIRKCLLARVASIELSVSRVDVFADCQGWRPIESDRDRLVTRAQHRMTYERSGDLTGFTFGRRSSGMCARIYNKTEEVKNKGHGVYWFDIWGNAYRPELPVWRLEFEFSRSTLREFGLRTAEDVVAGAADLWSYATQEWMTLRDRTDDATRSRWATSSEWAALQRADLGVAPIGLARVRAARHSGSLEHATQRLVRCLVLFGALNGRDNLGDTMVDIPSAVTSYELLTARPFDDELKHKRRELAF